MNPRKPITDAIVAAAGRNVFNDAANLRDLDLLLDRFGIAREGTATAAAANRGDPDWLARARALMGTREIVGPKHNAWIVQQWAKLGASWFNDDETPWCGLFVAHCLQAVGLTYPGKGMFARALSWKDWGRPAGGELLGAVAVFQRSGGGHVAFLVGQNAKQVYVLGGNQSNSVNIMPIDRSRLVALRWPQERALGTVKAPAMQGGVVSVNER